MSKATAQNTFKDIDGPFVNYMADASDLGLPPQKFPQRIRTTLGNKMDFIATGSDKDADGAISMVDYTQICGCTTLQVFNT